ncbi:MAG: type III pantothenate kinase [Psychroserpens sp.]|nr:type III pantothenate kinase [Psychroserpens sp.]
MNLIIDVGNTLVKLAVFHNNMLFERSVVASNAMLTEAKHYLTKYPIISNGIISSVGRSNQKDVEALQSEIDVLVLSHDLNLPFTNLYATPKTLGVDRIALVSASAIQYPDSNVLIIDAGTCITYDFINLDNEYLGGAISPGLRLRYKSLHNLTANLPLLDTELPESIIGNSTNSSIHSGVVVGAIKELDGAISEYKADYPDLTVILTGGDAKFLAKQLKNSIFANSNFLLEGLNVILEHNSN